MNHSEIRAMERYQICNFKPKKALFNIFRGDALLLEVNLSKLSRKFLTLYNNKYIIVVTDIGTNFIKTLLPYEPKYNNALEKLIQMKGKNHGI